MTNEQIKDAVGDQLSGLIRDMREREMSPEQEARAMALLNQFDVIAMNVEAISKEIKTFLART